MLRQLMLEGNADIGYILTRNAALRVTHSNWRQKVGRA